MVRVARAPPAGAAHGAERSTGGSPARGAHRQLSDVACPNAARESGKKAPLSEATLAEDRVVYFFMEHVWGQRGCSTGATETAVLKVVQALSGLYGGESQAERRLCLCLQMRKDRRTSEGFHVRHWGWKRINETSKEAATKETVAKMKPSRLESSGATWLHR